MRDERIKKLAAVLLNHSVKVKKGERVLIRGHLNTKPLITEIIDQTYSLGAYPYVEILDDEITLHLAKNYQKAQLETQAKWQMQTYQDVDAVIVIIGEENDAEMDEVPAEMHKLRGEIMKPVSEFYVNHRKWVLLNYPTKGLAQKAGMSTSSFEDYLFDVCTVDYDKMASAAEPLKQLMEKTDRVRITGPGTDLQFSIKGIPVIPCTGEANVPDGEIFTAPIKDSVNGTISFNTPCPYHGITFRDVKLTFENGKIVDAVSDQTEKLNEILDTDEGARYIGEFALGFHPYIEEPIGDILFDEKICGSFHFTPGEAYEEANNGNKSAIHWDMVLIQRPEYGGGEIYFDDVLVRKDGQFVLPELKGLNQENLK
ncbi:aminopeptidase [Metabacillus halosaccharovorans]|uniref:Aminopeptidase n=1 Tax=Metabacillus halosaccharovorans TaxID=930124 RepID=A0ABT3DG93_9BACI|nr:aminopeptidase [Metabacillus halosaccharovorans]MCV9886031.1 aminopeptidase [Metabacillus halosaccharovorans]